MRTSDFDYDLPDSSIAQEPAAVRDDSRLLDTRDGSHHRFRDLPLLLEPGDLVVVNRTRVMPARLVTRRQGSGGRVELLVLRSIGPDLWEALAKPIRRLRPGVRLEAAGAVVEVAGEPAAGMVSIRVLEGSIEDAMRTGGRLPLPPYFRGSLDPERYQTIYGDVEASTAAPTAGLHFTPQVMETLEARGVETASVHLEIGLDTFLPIRTPAIEDHTMHTERVAVSPAVVESVTGARRRGGRVVAIGTTVVRALESAARRGDLTPFEGATDLYIVPGFEFRVVDLLVTNFHLPCSTLVVMVAAFMGEEWRDAYASALNGGYRFLSFGDAMLAERAA